MIFDRLKGHRAKPLRIAEEAIAARHKEHRAEERKELQGAEPLLGLIANDAIPLDDVDPEMVGRLLDEHWRRHVR